MTAQTATMTAEQLKAALSDKRRKRNRVECERCGHQRVEHSQLGPCTLHWCECDEFKAPHKYSARRVVVDGISFPSQREADRWRELLELQRHGHITNLRRQVRYKLVMETHYVADFEFDVQHSGEHWVEDAKGFATREYLRKRKAMKEQHGIEIREV